MDSMLEHDMLIALWACHCAMFDIPAKYEVAMIRLQDYDDMPIRVYQGV
ncbi:MAG: hypothetical protein WCK15_14975 [Pirellula sp.]